MYFAKFHILQLLLDLIFSSQKRMSRPKVDHWSTLGLLNILLNILNGINVANPWPMYAATRMFLKYCIWQNFLFYRFSKYLGSQPYQKDWTTLELLEVIHETVTLAKVLRKNYNHRYLQKNVFCLILHLTLARILVFSL